MSVEVCPVPAIDITQETSSVSRATQCLVEVITGVASFSCIIFVFSSHQLPSGYCIQLVNIIKRFLITGIQVGKEVGRYSYSVAYRIIPHTVFIT